MAAHPTARLCARRLRATFLPSAALPLVLLSASAGAQEPPVYHATFLGAGSHVAAMNEAGTVVYRGSIGVIPRAYVAGPGQPATFLPVPFGFLSSTPTDINEAGVITGIMSPYQTTAFYAWPAVWHPDGSGGYTVTLLETLPGADRGTADALNDVGDIIGTSSTTNVHHTVLFTDAGTVELPGLGSLPPTAVNNQRVYVSHGAQLVHLDTLQVETPGFPAGSSATPGYVLNESNQVAGALSQACGQVAAVHTPGLGWDVLSACGLSTACFDLDDQGNVLMKIGGVPYVRLAGQGLHRVEDLIAEDDGHWTVNSPAGIALSDNRQMAVVASNSTTGQSGVILLTPEVCQADLGYGGPGSMHLSMCGGPLSSGSSADFHVAGGVPFGLAWLFLGVVENPLPFYGGVLVPVPWAAIEFLPLDGAGSVTVPGVPGGGGPFSAYLQAAMPDPGQTFGVSISNVLRLDFLP